MALTIEQCLILIGLFIIICTPAHSQSPAQTVVNAYPASTKSNATDSANNASLTEELSGSLSDQMHLPEILGLVSKGANVNTVGRDGGNTAIMVAAYYKNADAVKTLIAAGANVNAEDSYGNTALMDSFQPASEDIPNPADIAAIVNLLISAGADVNWPTGFTPLMAAASAGNGDAVKALIAAGANVNAQFNYNGDTPLIYAALSGNTKSVQYLLAAGADTTAVNSLGHSVTRIAIRSNGEIYEQIVAAYDSEIVHFVTIPILLAIIVGIGLLIRAKTTRFRSIASHKNARAIAAAKVVYIDTEEEVTLLERARKEAILSCGWERLIGIVICEVSLVSCVVGFIVTNRFTEPPGQLVGAWLVVSSLFLAISGGYHIAKSLGRNPFWCLVGFFTLLLPNQNCRFEIRYRPEPTGNGPEDENGRSIRFSSDFVDREGVVA